MKALSLRPQWAMKVLLGEKTIECRSWKTSYRGDLLICSSARKASGTIPGHALCVVELVDVVPFEQEHMSPACLDGLEIPEECYAWKLANLRWIAPFPHKGQLGLYTVDDALIELLSSSETMDADVFDSMFSPLVYWDKDTPRKLL